MTIRWRFRDKCKAEKGQLLTFFSFRNILNCFTVSSNTQAYHWKPKGGLPEAISTIIGTILKQKNSLPTFVFIALLTSLNPLNFKSSLQFANTGILHTGTKHALQPSLWLYCSANLDRYPGPQFPQSRKKKNWHCVNPKPHCKQGTFGFRWSSVARKRHFETNPDVKTSSAPFASFFTVPCCLL